MSLRQLNNLVAFMAIFCYAAAWGPLFFTNSPYVGVNAIVWMFAYIGFILWAMRKRDRLR